MTEKENTYIGCSSEDRMIIRPEIMEVTKALELMMRKHDPKKGDSWQTMDFNQLFANYREEYSEVFSAIAGLHPCKRIMDELLDSMLLGVMMWQRTKFVFGAFGDVELNQDKLNIKINQRTVRQIQKGSRCPDCDSDCRNFANEADCCICETVIGRTYSELYSEHADRIYEYNNTPVILIQLEKNNESIRVQNDISVEQRV